MPQIFALISSGSNLTDSLDLRRWRLVSALIPVVDSGDLLVKAAFDNSSASFMRVLEPRFGGSLEMRLPIQAGSRAVTFPPQLETFPFLKLETVLGGVGSLQTSPRTLVLMTAPR